jgi:hypothetical protein
MDYSTTMTLKDVDGSLDVVITPVASWNAGIAGQSVSGHRTFSPQLPSAGTASASLVFDLGSSVLGQFTGVSGDSSNPLNVNALSLSTVSQYTATVHNTSGAVVPQKSGTTTHWTVASTQTPQGTFVGTVTYTYAAVPEAGTLLLGGAAVMPILGYRRRSRKA